MEFPPAFRDPPGRCSSELGASGSSTGEEQQQCRVLLLLIILFLLAIIYRRFAEATSVVRGQDSSSNKGSSSCAAQYQDRHQLCWLQSLTVLPLTTGSIRSESTAAMHELDECSQSCGHDQHRIFSDMCSANSREAGPPPSSAKKAEMTGLTVRWTLCDEAVHVRSCQAMSDKL